MLTLLDNAFPWLGDMLELGGDILLLIIAIAAVLWTLILERLAYQFWIFPRQRLVALGMWNARADKTSWFADKFRRRLLAKLKRDLFRNQNLVSTLVKVCPLLGLLGTVLGMLEIFDALSVTGNNSARATAGGVSKATVSTMAGMVVAISGMMISDLLNRHAQNCHQSLQQDITIPDTEEVQHA